MIRIKNSMFLVPIIMMLAVLFSGSCGKDTTAVDVDTIIAPGNTTYTADGCNQFQLPWPYSPLVFTLMSAPTASSASGVPKNDVYLDFYTKGIFYTDDTYSVEMTSSGPMRHIRMKTDANGQVTLFWSTLNLPAANNAVGSTPGADIEEFYWVQAYSGTNSATFQTDIKIKGCQP